MKKVLFISSIVIVVAFAGFLVYRSFPQKNGVITKKMQVTTSFYPLYYFASVIAGDKADVYNITPAGSEPHDYEPTFADMVQLEKSKLVILNGGNFEPWTGRVVKNKTGTDSMVLLVSDGLTSLLNTPQTQDPHVWLSPKGAVEQVKRIAHALKKIDPKNSAYYEERMYGLLAKLESLDVQFQTGLKNCARREIVTAHAAFGHLADAYHLEQVAIAGLSPSDEPSVQDIIRITDFAKKHRVKFIFFESLVNPKFAKTLAQEVGAETLVLNPLESLTKEEIEQGKNYFTEMQKNLSHLRIALSCP